MLFFYVDESGTGLKDIQSPYFLLAAIAVPADVWPQLDSAFSQLKRRLIGYAKPEDWEIKGRDMRRGDLLFKAQNWTTRLAGMQLVADFLAETPVKAFAVRVDKRDLPEFVADPSDLYRLALWRLLDELDSELARVHQQGIVMLDARADLHSSVQDRRVVDAFRDWLATRNGKTQFVEVPWFGFSSFYAGLQLADFVAYLVDVVSNEEYLGPTAAPPSRERAAGLQRVFDTIRGKVTLMLIP